MVTNTGIRWRRALRLLRAQSPQVRGLAAAVTMLLVANAALIGVRSTQDGRPTITDPAVATGDEVPGDPGTDGAADDTSRDGGTSDASDTGAEPGEPTTPGTNGTTGSDGPTDGSDPGTATSGSDGGGTATSGGSEDGTTSGSAAAGTAGTTGTTTGPPRNYTASDRGVTAETVKLALPWFDLAATFQVTGSGNDDIENAENVIEAMVEWINANGGIDGRLIDPLIEEFNPLNETDMRAKCIRWAQDDEVFGVVDAGGWHAQHQLCLTQENDTPLISEWTTTEEWTERGDPYLWWTAASAEETVENLMLWIREAGLEPEGEPLGVLFADRQGDRLTREYLEAINARLGYDLHIEVLPYDNAQAQAAVPGAVQRMRTAGVSRVLGMLPLTTMAFWLNGAESQNFFPHYVLSDYETNLVTAQALLGAQFPDSLDRAVGPTSFPLGQVDDPVNYRPAEKQCNDVWKSQRPDSEDLDIGGVGMRWCQNIFLFVEAATHASVAGNGVLTRDSWADAMGTIRDRPSQMTPVMSFSPTDRSGPTQVKVIELHIGDCSEELDDDGNGACHVEVSGYEPYRTL